ELTTASVVDDGPAQRVGDVILVAPVHHCPDDRPQLLALAGQRVLVPAARADRRRHDLVFDEQSQSFGQHGRRYLEMRAEVAEAYDAVEGITDDQQRPPLAHYLERARDGTQLVLVLTLERHDTMLVHSPKQLP